MNSLAGVLSTLASVLGTQGSTFSISSTSTIVVTSAIAGICGILSAFYMFVLIRRLKKEHDGEVGKQRAGKHGEGYADLSKRKGAGKMV
jgi:membrane-bound ClpP family serine protease